MANVKITDLVAYTNPVSTDVLAIVDVGADTTKKVSIAALLQNASSGTAAAPGIAFDGDNIGIYRPGADQVAISTNGTEKLRITSDGKLGLGTSSPQKLLEISSSTDATIRINDPATIGAVNRYIGGVEYYTNDSSGGAKVACSIKGYHVDISGNGRLQFATGNETTAMTIDGSQRVGIGTTSPESILQVGSNSNDNANTSNYISFGRRATTTENSMPFIGMAGANGGNQDLGLGARSANGVIKFYTGSAGDAFNAALERLRIDENGDVGIGTTSPDSLLHVSGGVPRIQLTDTDTGVDHLINANSSVGVLEIECDINAEGSSPSIRFGVGGLERARIDSSGRLLVGASSARSNLFNSTVAVPFQVEGTGTSSAGISVIANPGAVAEDSAVVVLGKSRGSSVGGTTIVASDDELGVLSYQGSDGSEFVEGARISCEVDGTPGANDMPGRLVFSTTADGASSPTERLRVDSSGRVMIPNGVSPAPETNSGTDGITLGCTSGSYAQFAKIGSSVAGFNRMTDDGTIIRLMQAGTEEGTISVSGTTVSYNGAHLSRWSQLPGGAVREEILRGTVLSNIDEMCGWGDEDNEQLNRMKVSDVEGDPNVSGVFQSWDDDDDTYTDDFYCAMTGDFIIRIAEGVTVQRGDLLMSAGDGTAKPQDDDIIRSKTIAKVTSTHVTCTYDDGSYCVPCVLMAC